MCDAGYRAWGMAIHRLYRLAEAAIAEDEAGAELMGVPGSTMDSFPLSLPTI